MISWFCVYCGGWYGKWTRRGGRRELEINEVEWKKEANGEGETKYKKFMAVTKDGIRERIK